MDGAVFIDKRGKRHMARALEAYEKAHPSGSDKFKAILRDEFKELIGDARDVIDATREGQEINGYAVELRDRAGRTPQRSTA
jgi:hypothetical protein